MPRDQRVTAERPEGGACQDRGAPADRGDPGTEQQCGRGAELLREHPCGKAAQRHDAERGQHVESEDPPTQAYSESSSTGAVEAAETNPSNAGEFVRARTSQPSAVPCIHEPTSDTTTPARKRR